ncbi:MAG: S8 family peptidase [Saprospiraceae bacterium]|nr:S8 family peptidase [Saprospiraceae bacterium]
MKFLSVKKVYLVFLGLIQFVLGSNTTLFAQSNYYWTDGEKYHLSEDRSSIILHFKEGYAVEKYLKEDAPVKDLTMHALYKRAVLQFSEEYDGQAIDLAKEMVTDPSAIRSASFAYQYEDGFQVWLTHRVVLELKAGTTIEAIEPLMERAEASLVKQEYGRTLIELKNIDRVFSLANKLEEQDLVSWAHPDFYAKISTDNHVNYNFYPAPSDPKFTQQYQLHQNNDIDCDAPEAWQWTKGSSNITVAVVDDGLMNSGHPDLPNFLANKNKETPSFGAASAHGYACAGIINAAHNNIGVSGVAPGVKLFGVWFGGSASENADAISYAQQQGADVMNNSWSYKSCSVSFGVLNSAINNAVNNGRNGKGCVLVFTAGNDGRNNCINYPAKLGNVIAVGAVGRNGSATSYSNRGPALDLVAPSSQDANQPDVWTTDLISNHWGHKGYNTASGTAGHYTSDFNGTSAAAPVVSGVAALVLSLRPDFTFQQVYSVMTYSATDMGANGRDNTFGWGRVDADDSFINSAVSKCLKINTNASNIYSYGNQDQGQYIKYNWGGIHLHGSAWKSILLDYVVTEHTRIGFWYYSWPGQEGGIHGIGFDDNNSIDYNRIFKIYGTQNLGINNYDNYNGSGWQYYEIPVGQFYTGWMNRIFLVNQKNNLNNTWGQGVFDQISVYEAGNNWNCNSYSRDGTPQPPSYIPDFKQDREHDITNIEYMDLPEDAAISIFPNPASTLINLQLDVKNTMAVRCRITNSLGQVVKEQSINAGLQQIDISTLPTGIYYITVDLSDGKKSVHKFSKK